MAISETPRSFRKWDLSEDWSVRDLAGGAFAGAGTSIGRGADVVVPTIDFTIAFDNFDFAPVDYAPLARGTVDAPFVVHDSVVDVQAKFGDIFDAPAVAVSAAPDFALDNIVYMETAPTEIGGGRPPFIDLALSPHEEHGTMNAKLDLQNVEPYVDIWSIFPPAEPPVG